MALNGKPQPRVFGRPDRRRSAVRFAFPRPCEVEPAGTPQSQPPPRLPMPFPFPVPGRGGRRFPFLLGAQRGGGWRVNDDRVNVAALREMTDDSGGRTEVVRDARDLNPSTASIADELSKQYYLGYQASGKNDGRWHTIRVEVRSGRYVVRARKGYIAS